MDVLRKSLVMLLGLTVGVSGGILVMLYGWGVRPEGWRWIIGGGVGIQLLAQIFIVIGSSEK